MLSYQEIINKIDKLEEANILICAFELRIFSILKKRSMSAKEVSKVAKTKLDGTQMLLNALSSMGALEKRVNRYKNTRVTYKYFCESSINYKKGTVMLKQGNRDEYEQLAQIVKEGRNLKSFEEEDDAKFRHLFTYAMHERSEKYVDKVAEIVTKNPVGKLIDLGCGPGSYSVAFLKREKKSTAVLMDRPVAISVARKIHKKDPTYMRLKFISGDIFKDSFGAEFDTVFLSNVLHIYNPRENTTLFRKIYKALNKGGRFILYDLFLKDNQISPYDASLFAITMLLYTKTGKSYTFSEVELLLRDVGFVGFKRLKAEHGSSIIEARKA